MADQALPERTLSEQAYSKILQAVGNQCRSALQHYYPGGASELLLEMRTNPACLLRVPALGARNWARILGAMLVDGAVTWNEYMWETHLRSSGKASRKAANLSLREMGWAGPFFTEDDLVEAKSKHAAWARPIKRLELLKQRRADLAAKLEDLDAEISALIDGKAA